MSLQMPSTVIEADGSADICVYISSIIEPPEVDIVVELEISNGTAMAGNN